MKNLDTTIDSNEKEFIFLITKLIPPKSKTNKILKVLVGDTVFFENGDPCLITYNSKVFNLTDIHIFLFIYL